MRHDRRRTGRGFTLVSLLVALLVIGTLSSILLPALLENSYRAKVQNVARQTAIQMRLARFRAIRQGRAFGVFADFTNNRVTMFDGDVPDLPTNEVGGFELPTTINFQYPGEAANGTNAVGGNFTADAGGGYVVFDATGAADKDGWFTFGMEERQQYFKVDLPTQATANVRLLYWDNTDDRWETAGRDDL